jgi:hypothetical protein
VSDNFWRGEGPCERFKDSEPHEARKFVGAPCSDGPWMARPSLDSLSKHLLHGLALGEFIDELVQLANLFHQRSSTSSTRTPQTRPLMSELFGCIAGA